MGIAACFLLVVAIVSIPLLFKNKSQKKIPAIDTNKVAESVVKDLKNQGFDVKYEIKSFSNPNINYSVDPAKVTCTCENFDRRGHYPTDDPRRLCKHLIAVYAGLNDYPRQLEKYCKIIKSLFAQKRAFDISENMATATIYKTTYIFVWENNGDWINIYDGTGRYGFNNFEGRWSYGKAPANEAQLIKFIEKNIN